MKLIDLCRSRFMLWTTPIDKDCFFFSKIVAERIENNVDEFTA